MKKLLCIAFAAVCLCACGGNEPTKTMSCTLSTAENGVESKIDMDMDYEGSVVMKQNQTAVFTADTKEMYDAILPVLQAASKEEYKEIGGVSYDFTENEKDLTVKEEIKIDFEKIDAKDYMEMTGDSTLDISKTKIDVDKTKTNLEKQGYKCTK